MLFLTKIFSPKQVFQVLLLEGEQKKNAHKPGSTVLIVILAVGSTETRAARAGEGVDIILTSSTILTGVRCTLVNVSLTMLSPKATNTLALVVSNKVQACPTI